MHHETSYNIESPCFQIFLEKRWFPSVGRWQTYNSQIKFCSVHSTEYHEEIIHFLETQGKKKIPNISFWFQLYTRNCLSQSSSELSKSFRNGILQFNIPLKRKPHAASLPCACGRQKTETVDCQFTENSNETRKLKVTATILVVKACKKKVIHMQKYSPWTTSNNGQWTPYPSSMLLFHPKPCPSSQKSQFPASSPQQWHE